MWNPEARLLKTSKQFFIEIWTRMSRFRMAQFLIGTIAITIRLTLWKPDNFKCDLQKSWYSNFISPYKSRLYLMFNVWEHKCNSGHDRNNGQLVSWPELLRPWNKFFMTMVEIHQALLTQFSLLAELFIVVHLKFATTMGIWIANYSYSGHGFNSKLKVCVSGHGLNNELIVRYSGHRLVDW